MTTQNKAINQLLSQGIDKAVKKSLEKKEKGKVIS